MTADLSNRSSPLAIDDSGVHDSILMLDEREAAREVLDDLNRRRLRQMLWLFSVLTAIYTLASLAHASFWRAALAAAMLTANLVLLRHRHSPPIAGAVRLVSTLILVGNLLLLQVLHIDTDTEMVLTWYVVLPILAARFRFSAGELAALFLSLYSVSTTRLLVENLILHEELLPLVVVALSVLLCWYLPLFLLASILTRSRLRRFLTRWRAETGRHRERLRMKQELEYARKIQLSMLPREAPQVGWLDIAALSLPATEVGGDYYDYFPLGDDRLGVVVGDVTGHGVASGLVLSGVRAGLNLLQDELGAPRQILRRINTMLKRTTTRHMLMTLGLVVLDRSDRTAIVATAGHPPVLLRRCCDNQVVEVGSGSFPLGAMYGTEYGETKVALGSGDVLLLYSDGLVETCNSRQDQYGWHRLHRQLADRTDGSAKEIRDAILRDVWGFKSDAEQADDVTMVVIRVI